MRKKTGANSEYILMQHEKLKPARDTEECLYNSYVSNAQRKQRAVEWGITHSRTEFV